MLARIAQELFWLGRDLTRAEHTARILDGAFHADVAGAPGERGIALSWEGVLATIGAKPLAPGEDDAPVSEEAAAVLEEAVAAVPEAAQLFGRGEVARLLTLDTDSPASVVSCVARARERGRTHARCHLDRDVGGVELLLSAAGALRPAGSAAHRPLFRLSGGQGTLRPVLGTGRPHHAPRRGPRLPGGGRADRGGRHGHAHAAGGHPHGSLDEGHEAEALALLHAVGGFQAYRRAVRVAPTVRPVVQFLLFDSAYPGSVASSVDALAAALTAADAQPRSSPPVLRLGRLIADLELQRRAPDPSRALDQTLERVQDELEMVDRDIDSRYFAIAALAAVHL